MDRSFSPYLGALVLAGACFSPASAGPSSYQVQGSVASACSLSATQITFTVSRNGGNITPTFSPASVTASCNKSGGGVLSISSSRLSPTKDYTLSIAGWGTPAMTYATGSPAAPPTTRSSAIFGNITIIPSCSNGCSTNNLSNNSTYTATVTLSLSANP